MVKEFNRKIKTFFTEIKAKYLLLISEITSHEVLQTQLWNIDENWLRFDPNRRVAPIAPENQLASIRFLFLAACGRLHCRFKPHLDTSQVYQVYQVYQVNQDSLSTLMSCWCQSGVFDGWCPLLGDLQWREGTWSECNSEGCYDKLGSPHIALQSPISLQMFTMIHQNCHVYYVLCTIKDFGS